MCDYEDDLVSRKEGEVELYTGKGNSSGNYDHDENYKTDKFQPAWGSKGFYNPQMGLYRDMVLLIALSARLNTQQNDNKITTKEYCFLDAFSGCGALALRIAKMFEKVSDGKASCNTYITVNDVAEKCQQIIHKNILSNSLNNSCVNLNTAKDSDKDQEMKLQGNVFLNVTGKDAKLLMYEAISKNTNFDYIHLDPFGCVVPFLDAAISSLKVGEGILTLTATDTGALFDRRYLKVAKRHYNLVNLNKDRGICFREMGLRMVIAVIAQAANRQDKGIEVLISFSAEHFLFVGVKIRWDTKDSTCESLKMVNVPKFSSFPNDISVTNNADLEGPLWMGKLGNNTVIRQLDQILDHSPHPGKFATSQKKIKKLIQTLGEEFQFESSSPWFYSLSRISSLLGTAHVPSKASILKSLHGMVFKISYKKDQSDIPCSITCNENLDRDAPESDNIFLFSYYIVKASLTHFHPQSIKMESILLNDMKQIPESGAILGTERLNCFILDYVIKNKHDDL